MTFRQIRMNASESAPISQSLRFSRWTVVFAEDFLTVGESLIGADTSTNR
jgi:hypothetical protein